jgi:Listeria-Bacteroides repeat domain (List_Bact_rpt).
MATATSWVTNQWYTQCNAAITSESATSVTIHVDVGVYSVYANSSYTNAYAWCNSGGQQNYITDGHVSPGNMSWLTSGDYSVAKNQSVQSIYCSGKAWMPGASVASYQTGAEAGLYLSVPALASHTVSYNANGGSGAPGNQTKWYGSILTLSSTTPTRDGYSFLGWATSSSGSVAYSPGGSYGADADVTLYAVWQQLYISPSFTSADAHRTTSSSSTDTNPTGEYAYSAFSWAVDTSYTSGNTAKSIILRYRNTAVGNDGQWRWERYKHTDRTVIIPDLSMISGTPEATGYSSDSTTFLDANSEDDFLEVWETYATIVTAFTWAVTIQSDDDFSMLIDGSVVAHGGCGTGSFSISIPTGTHRIDFMLREGAGTEILKITSGKQFSSVVANITAPITLGTAPAWTTVTPTGTTTGTSGTVTTSFSAALQTSYLVQCIATDNSGNLAASTTINRVIALAAIPIDIGSKGSAVGLLHAAPSSGLEVGDNAVFDKNVSVTGETTTTKLKVSSTGCHVLGIWYGSWVGATDSNGAAILLSYSDLMTLTNGLINSGMMMVYTMDGDMDASAFRVSGGIHEGNTALWACTTVANGWIRINWTFMVLG